MTRLAIALLAICALTRIAHAADPLPVRITVIADLDDGIHNARPGRGGAAAWTRRAWRWRISAAPFWAGRS